VAGPNHPPIHPPTTHHPPSNPALAKERVQRTRLARPLRISPRMAGNSGFSRPGWGIVPGGWFCPWCSLCSPFPGQRSLIQTLNKSHCGVYFNFYVNINYERQGSGRPFREMVISRSRIHRQDTGTPARSVEFMPLYIPIYRAFIISHFNTYELSF